MEDDDDSSDFAIAPYFKTQIYIGEQDVTNCLDTKTEATINLVSIHIALKHMRKRVQHVYTYGKDSSLPCKLQFIRPCN